MLDQKNENEKFEQKAMGKHISVQNWHAHWPSQINIEPKNNAGYPDLFDQASLHYFFRWWQKSAISIQSQL